MPDIGSFAAAREILAVLEKAGEGRPGGRPHLRGRLRHDLGAGGRHHRGAEGRGVPAPAAGGGRHPFVQHRAQAPLRGQGRAAGPRGVPGDRLGPAPFGRSRRRPVGDRLRPVHPRPHDVRGRDRRPRAVRPPVRGPGGGPLAPHGRGGRPAARDPEAGRPGLPQVVHALVGTNRTAMDAAAEAREREGADVVLLPGFLRGRGTGLRAGVLRSAARRAATALPPGRTVALVAGGETTVQVRGDGKGGRNQEFALAAAIELAGAEGMAVLAGGTDGVDGPTDAAGAYADGTTAARAKAPGSTRARTSPTTTPTRSSRRWGTWSSRDRPARTSPTWPSGSPARGADPSRRPCTMAFTEAALPGSSEAQGIRRQSSRSSGPGA